MIRYSGIRKAMRKALGMVGFATLACLTLITFLGSQQSEDLRHSITYIRGLLDHGLSYYAIGNGLGYESNYIPGLYALLGLSIAPSLILTKLTRASACDLSIQSDCSVEAIFLKIAIATLAVASCWMLQLVINSDQEEIALERERIRKPWNSRAITLLLTPTVLYSWLFFGAYDGLGAFAAILGPCIFLKREELCRKYKINKSLLSTAGLAICTLAASAKFFPVVIILGLSIGLSKNRKDSLTCLTVPTLLTAAQVVVVSKLGAKPLSIVSDKLVQESPILYEKWIAALLILAFTTLLLFRHNKYNNRLGLGFLTSTAILAIGFPTIRWHPQWQLYYGVSLYFAMLFIVKRKRTEYLLTLLLVIQAFCFVITVQWWADNADITMTLRSINKTLIPHAFDLAGQLRFDLLTLNNNTWKAFSLSQIGTVLILLIELAHNQSISKNDERSSKDPRWARSSGYSFIAAWYLLAIASIFIVPGWQTRLEAGTGKKIEINKLISREEKGHLTDGQHLKYNAIQLTNGVTWTFNLTDAIKKNTTAKDAMIVIGKNSGQSQGKLKICLTNEMKAGEHTKESENCRNLNLNDAKDGLPTWFTLDLTSKSQWDRITITSYQERSGLAPILFTTTKGWPYIIVYESRQ
jgi:hypothetical protein